jgi:hypothetical protein
MGTQREEALTTRLRAAYEKGTRIAEIIRREADFSGRSPVEIMTAFIDAFGVGLSDVSCIDGWWPPGEISEVTDENLHLFISDAIEARREQWSGKKST